MPPRRRPKPRLRTKSGCFKCRMRRKKCDENRPQCRGCIRNGHLCLWPEQLTPSPSDQESIEEVTGHRSVSTDETRVDTVLSKTLTPWHQSPPQSCSSSPKSNPDDRTFETEEYLLHYFGTKFAPLLLRPHAHPTYRDFSYMYDLVHQGSWVRSAYLACGALHASWEMASLRRAATVHYNAAVSSLHSAMADGRLDGSEDSMLATVIFLYIYEKWHCGSSSLAALHLGGMARVLQVRMQKNKSQPSSDMLPFYRVATESFVYQISTLCLYDADIVQLSAIFSWADLDLYLAKNDLDDSATHLTSPLLGSPLRLYRIIFEVSSLYQKTPHSANTIAAAQGYENELGELCKTLEDNAFDDEEEQCSTPSADRRETLLYIISTQILVFGLLNPDADVSHPRIRQLSDAALDIIRQLVMSVSCSSFFCWPMMVLGHTVTQSEDVEFLKSKFLELWDVSFCGQIRRFAKLMEEVWRDRKLNSGNVVDGVRGMMKIIESQRESRGGIRDVTVCTNS